MLKKISVLFFACIVSAACSISVAQVMKIAVVSDIHFLSPSLMVDGAAIQNYEKNSGKNIRDTPAVLDEVINSLEQQSPEILLISGDLTKDGEKQSHLDLKKRLDVLKNKGVRIFVTPGNHDINVPHPLSYSGEQTVPVANVSADDFVHIYNDFGFEQAFSRDKSSLSYVVALDDKTWLLCIDSNRYPEYITGTISAGRILPETESWAIALLQQAKEKNISVLGMMHHGLVEHFPYQSMFFSDYLIDDWQRLAREFADNGMKVVFTGHFHANDITAYNSSTGNTLYDVETGSLSSFPFPYRNISWNGVDMDITTHRINSIQGKPDMAVRDSISKYEYAAAAAKQRIKRKIPFLPGSTADGIAQLIGKIYVMHVRGDEVMDEDMRKKVQKFAGLLDNGDSEIDPSDTQLDFPPADNNVRLSFPK